MKRTNRSGTGEGATTRRDLKWVHDDLGDDDEDGEDEEADEVWDRRRAFIYEHFYSLF